jgi:tRNA (guanine-N7-)-methyltransferase
METTLIRLKLDFTDKIYVFSDEIKPQITPYVKYDKIDFKEIFGNENPVNVEIGIGNGEFIAHYAALNKNENFIGFEVYKKVIRKAIKRCEKLDSKNVRLIHYDGAFFVNLFPDNSINNFYINFPDPWPKKKHNKRRLLKTDFLQLLSNKLANNGHIFIATDHNDYGEEILENLKPVPPLTSCFEKPYETDLIDYYQTKYYRKFAIPGKIHFFKLKKVCREVI